MATLDECEFLGWALLDLDDPIPKRALRIAQARGIQVEDFIEEAIAEKLARIDAAEKSGTAIARDHQSGTFGDERSI